MLLFIAFDCNEILIKEVDGYKLGVVSEFYLIYVTLLENAIRFTCYVMY